MRQWVLRVAALLVAGLSLTGSALLHDADPWVSGTLSNLGVTVLLVVPIEWFTRRLSQQVRSVGRAAERAQVAAAGVQADVDILEESIAENQRLHLADVREALAAEQLARLAAEVQVYEDWGRLGDRESTVSALKQGAETGLIATRGLRSPIWETALHLGFRLDEDGEPLTLTIETDAGTVRSRHVWPAGSTTTDMVRDLEEAMKNLGEHLGPLLFDPTESVESASKALAYASRYRAQKLNMGARNLENIIEFVDGWFITERGLCPRDHEYYFIDVSRLWEMDWEQHITDKGWDGIYTAMKVARELHASRRPEG